MMSEDESVNQQLVKGQVSSSIVCTCLSKSLVLVKGNAEPLQFSIGECIHSYSRCTGHLRWPLGHRQVKININPLCVFGSTTTRYRLTVWRQPWYHLQSHLYPFGWQRARPALTSIATIEDKSQPEGIRWNTTLQAQLQGELSGISTAFVG